MLRRAFSSAGREDKVATRGAVPSMVDLCIYLFIQVSSAGVTSDYAGQASMANFGRLLASNDYRAVTAGIVSICRIDCDSVAIAVCKQQPRNKKKKKRNEHDLESLHHDEAGKPE